MFKTLIIGAALLFLCAGVPAVSAIGGDQGWYRIHCNIDGADVYFDGQYKGTTYGGSLDVPVYTTATPFKTVRVEKSGYLTHSGSLPAEPGAGQTADVYVTLQPVETVGSIHVTSSPSGAAIYLNGNYQGVAPITIKNLAPGTYSLDADYSGYQSDRATVTVRAGQQSDVRFTLTPIEQYGSVKISSNPSGAYVYMDGVYKGRTPLTLNSVSAKNHIIELDLANYYDWKTTISVASGVTRYVNAQMTAIPSETTGAVDVVSYPAGADVFLDDKFQGKTPSAGVFTISNVRVGSHTVRVALSGYQDYTTAVDVSRATTSHVTAPLQPGQPSATTGSIAVTSSPSGAEIYIDNAYKGITPLTVDGVAAGTHAVRVALAGYSDWSTSVQVGSGSTASASASLSAVPTPAKAGMAPFAVVGALAILGLLAAGVKRD